jgi:hypothetical protein
MLNKNDVIKILNELDGGWPSDLWIWVTGDLHLMQGKTGGGRYMLPSGCVDPAYRIETFSNIECDGGDW